MATVGELRSSHDFSSPNSSSEYKIQKDPTVGGQSILSTQWIKLTCCPLNQISYATEMSSDKSMS